MDEYYQNGPLPTWIGWYVQHLPHWFHAASAAGTLVLELVLVFLLFFPRRVRLICFLIVTPWEAVVILTANYTFLNYLVLSLGLLLLDDKTLLRFVPARYRWQLSKLAIITKPPEDTSASEPGLGESDASPEPSSPSEIRYRLSAHLGAVRLAIAAIMLSWIFYNTTAEMIGIPLRQVPLPVAPITALEPFRISNQYGLFAVMTNGRYEIEFQGSNDGKNWIPYPFRYKPQALNEAPRIYAPYQPRFEWNLWFASLSDWRVNQLVPFTEERLLEGDPMYSRSSEAIHFFVSSPVRARSPLAVLVHIDGREAAHRELVASTVSWHLCS